MRTHMEGGAHPPPTESRFGFFARLVGNDHIALMIQLARDAEHSHWVAVMAKLEIITTALGNPEDTATLQAALAKLREADTVIDSIEPTQGVPQ